MFGTIKPTCLWMDGWDGIGISPDRSISRSPSGDNKESWNYLLEWINKMSQRHVDSTPVTVYQSQGLSTTFRTKRPEDTRTKVHWSQGQERAPRALTTALASLCNMFKYFRLLCKNWLTLTPHMVCCKVLQGDYFLDQQKKTSRFWFLSRKAGQLSPGGGHWRSPSFHPLLLDASNPGVVWPAIAPAVESLVFTFCLF